MAINEGVRVDIVERQATGVVDRECHLPGASPGGDVLAGKGIRLSDEFGGDTPTRSGDLSSEAHQARFTLL